METFKLTLSLCLLRRRIMARRITAIANAPACVGTPKVRKPRQRKQPQPERTVRAEVAYGEHGEQTKETKRHSPNMFYTNISDVCGLETKDVKAVFEALFDHVVTKLREDQKLEIPGIVLFTLKDTAARLAETKMIGDKEIQTAAKPPGKRVHPLILKPLKVAVNVTSD